MQCPPKFWALFPGRRQFCHIKYLAHLRNYFALNTFNKHSYSTVWSTRAQRNGRDLCAHKVISINAGEFSNGIPAPHMLRLCAEITFHIYHPWISGTLFRSTLLTICLMRYGLYTYKIASSSYGCAILLIITDTDHCYYTSIAPILIKIHLQITKAFTFRGSGILTHHLLITSFVSIPVTIAAY